LLTQITCLTLLCDVCGTPALTTEDTVFHLNTAAEAREWFGPGGDPWTAAHPWRFHPDGTHICPDCQTDTAGAGPATAPAAGGAGVAVNNDQRTGCDPYRVRAYRGLLGGWYAELDYLGDLEHHGDQRLTRARARTRLAAVTKALHVAADEHDTWAPHALLVVEISGTRFTGADARPGTWRP
jgi:hypothetical protein